MATMCDLIDLNSPDARKLITSKLASPLIPTPPGNDGPCTPSTGTNLLRSDKRGSLDNNPFDNVLKETSDYIRKKGDPFEVVLQKALKWKNQGDTRKACKVEFNDDFTPKRTRPNKVLKMNKTLDESLMEAERNKSLSEENVHPVSGVDQSIIQDLNNTNLLSESLKMSDGNRTDAHARINFSLPSICLQPPSPGNLSILNQSMMNDTFSENSSSSEENEIKALIAHRVSICIQNGTLEAGDFTKNNKKPEKMRRSLSHGDKKSPITPKKQATLFRKRSMSVIDTLKENLPHETGSSVFNKSAASYGTINRAFLGRGSVSSGISDVSSISAMSRLNSVSSVRSSSSTLSHTHMNRAFLKSCSSVTSCQSDPSEGSPFNSSSILRLKSSSSVVSGLMTPVKTPVKMSDLALRLQKLKLKSQMSSRNLVSENFEGEVMSSGSIEDNEKTENAVAEEKREDQQETDVRLIDVDIFMPAKEDTYKNRKKSSNSSVSSSDSVFNEDTNIDKSIFVEAKTLARTFRDLANEGSTASSSSGDDLLNSRPRWNFDALPSSDDEVLVDNLIELPPSPGKPETSSNVNTNSEFEIIKENKLLDLNTPKKDSDVIKELETEFVSQEVSEKKVMAATLLLDLEKLVNTETNPEAVKLLGNLQKALGVKCETNVELLATCLNETNDLTKSSKKSNSKIGSNENIRQESFEKSVEDNLSAGSSDSIKELELFKNKNIGNNFNVDKEINKNEKSMILADNKLADISPIIEVSEEGSSEKSISNDSFTIVKKQNQIAADQKIALDLLANLGKVLSGNNEDSTTLGLLTNLGRVLNLASNHLNFDTIQQNDLQIKEPVKVVKTDKVLSKKKVANTTEFAKLQPKPMAKSASRKSLDSATKNIEKSVEKQMRRSISDIRTPNSNIAAKAPVSTDKNRSLPRNIKKRFPSDPGTQKDIAVKPAVVPEIRKGKTPTVMGTVMSKFRKKNDSDIVVNKKGPMKATLPLGNMQRRGSLGKKVGPMSGQRTPPKASIDAPSAFTIASSTPNPPPTISFPKQSPKTKPVASSTPDNGGTKFRKIRPELKQSSCKRNMSCNISPVTSQSGLNTSNNSGSKKTATESNKTLSPPRGHIPKGRQTPNLAESSIPKFSPLVGPLRRKSTTDIAGSREDPRSPKITSVKSQTPKNSSLVHRKSESQIPQSPLKSNNKQSTKVKPFNLISKFRRGSSGSIVTDKENRA